MKKRKIISLLLAGAMAVGIAGCKNEKAEEGMVKLTWYIPAVLDSADFGDIMSKVNEKLESEYSLNLEIIGIDGGNYDKKMQLINAGMEEYDLAFTSTWKNDYYTNVSNGACLDITELLPEYAPKLYSSTSQTVWDALKIDGKIYAAPNWQIQAKATGLSIPDEYLEATGTDIDDINNFDDLEVFLEKLHSVNPECNKVLPAWEHVQRYYGYLDIIGQGMPGVVNYKENGKLTVINQYETQDYEDFIKLRRSWTEKGYMFDKYLPEDIKSSTMEKKEVRQRPFTLQVYSPGVEAVTLQSKGYAWSAKPLSDAILDAGGIMAAMTHVSATTKHPEAAVKMLEVINTDKEIFNLLVWGLEGKHYNKIGENKVEKISNSGYSGISHWILGSQANSFLLPQQDDNLWTELKAFNDNAIPSPILGFAAELDNISTEIANCKTVIEERSQMLDLGLVDPESGIAEFRQELKQAGVDTIIAELQKQIDGWSK